MPAMLSSDRSNLPRRAFLSLISRAALWLSGAGGLWAIGRYLSFEPGPKVQTRFPLEPAQAYPVGSVAVVPQARVALYRDEAGFYALSLICPHLGCTVERVRPGYLCPCHGSRFDEEGAVQNGPAVDPLRYVAVELGEDGRLVVDVGRAVGAQHRLRVG